MLVLSRQVGDEIVFPELGITVVVKKLKGKAVSVGVEAPEDIRILRGELSFDHGAPRAMDSRLMELSAS